MEKKAYQKMESYLSQLTETLGKKMEEGLFTDLQKSSIMEIIGSSEKPTFEKNDFVKRKRVQNAVSSCLRCSSKRSNGEQCSRKKKEGYDYCGTHLKGSFGVFKQESPNSIKVEVWAQDINGIIYYIDKEMNVYNTEDIINNIQNPAIITNYVKTGEVYSIPEFNI